MASAAFATMVPVASLRLFVAGLAEGSCAQAYSALSLSRPDSSEREDSSWCKLFLPPRIKHPLLSNALIGPNCLRSARQRQCQLDRSIPPVHCHGLTPLCPKWARMPIRSFI